jgi:hypothetical protein
MPYWAAVQRWPNTKITLRQCARVVHKSWQDKEAPAESAWPGRAGTCGADRGGEQAHGQRRIGAARLYRQPDQLRARSSARSRRRSAPMKPYERRHRSRRKRTAVGAPQARRSQLIRSLKAFRPSYRFLSYCFATVGYPVPNDLAGVDRPDLVDALVREVYAWAGLTPPH